MKQAQAVWLLILENTSPEYRGVIAYSEEAGFPVFTLPWEVHLVDFNRDLCNLIYKTMQEQDGLETALQKAIFSVKKNNSICLSCMRIISIKTQNSS